jgi:hypothetical protein
MRRFVAVLFVLALLFMSAGVALDANVAVYGPLNMRGGGVDSRTEAVAMGVSALAELGVLLLVIGAIPNLIRVTRQHQWGWLIVLAVLLPAGTYAFLNAGFEADVLSGVVSLIAPAAYLLYSLRAWPALRGSEPGG